MFWTAGCNHPSALLGDNTKIEYVFPFSISISPCVWLSPCHRLSTTRNPSADTDSHQTRPRVLPHSTPDSPPRTVAMYRDIVGLHVPLLLLQVYCGRGENKIQYKLWFDRAAFWFWDCSENTLDSQKFKVSCVTEEEVEKRRIRRREYPDNALERPKRVAEIPTNRALARKPAWNFSSQVTRWWLCRATYSNSRDEKEHGTGVTRDMRKAQHRRQYSAVACLQAVVASATAEGLGEFPSSQSKGQGPSIRVCTCVRGEGCTGPSVS